MPAIVLVGAQWGDEGKGKATDLLGRRVDAVVKFNGGNNAGHTIVIGTTARSTPCTCCRPGILTPGLHPDHRQRRGHRPRRAVRGDRRPRGARRRHVQAGRQQRRPRHRVVQPHPGQGHRALPGQRARSARPGAASARPTPTRWRRVGIRVQDLFDEDVLRAKVERRAGPQEPGAGQDLQPPGGRGRRRSSSELLRLRRRGCGRWSPTPRCCSSRLLDEGKTGGARGRPGHPARRRPRHLPVRHVLERDRRRRLHRVSGIPPTRISRVIAVVKAYTTRRRRGAVPDRAARRRAASGCARSAPSSA